MIETRIWPPPPLVPPAYPYSKWNVVQWFSNVEGMANWYHPEWPQWRRLLVWNFIRNPMFNFFRYVVGVEDRVISVTGPAPVFETTWTDADPKLSGWKWSIIRTGWLRLPFISFEQPAPGWVWYAGWLPSGGRLGWKGPIFKKLT